MQHPNFPPLKLYTPALGVFPGSTDEQGVFGTVSLTGQFFTHDTKRTLKPGLIEYRGCTLRTRLPGGYKRNDTVSRIVIDEGKSMMYTFSGDASAPNQVISLCLLALPTTPHDPVVEELVEPNTPRGSPPPSRPHPGQM